MNSTARSNEIFVIGLTSVYFVNLSTATNMCVKPPGAVGSGPIMSRLPQANGQDGGMVISCEQESDFVWRSTGILDSA